MSRRFAWVAGSLLALFIGALALCGVGVVLSLSESRAGTAWCEQQGGWRASGEMHAVLCIGPDGRVLPAPKNMDGSWP